MTYDDNDYLEHFGVKGMKWGVRKDRSESGSNNGPSRRDRVKSKVQAFKNSPYTQKAKASALNALANQPGIIVGAIAGAGLAAAKGKIGKKKLLKITRKKAALLNLYEDVSTKEMTDTLLRASKVEEYHRLKKAGFGSKALGTVGKRRR